MTDSAVKICGSAAQNKYKGLFCQKCEWAILQIRNIFRDGWTVARVQYKSTETGIPKHEFLCDYTLHSLCYCQTMFALTKTNSEKYNTMKQVTFSE